MSNQSTETVIVTSNVEQGASRQDEGCPTPLAWQEVLESVRKSGRRHEYKDNSVCLTATSFGEGVPLYLLPGFFGNHELYVLTSWLLREECCCVMVDPPVSHAGRKRPPGERLRDWAGTVVRLADELGHGRIRLYGPGFGGLIALQTMLDNPERIESATIQSGFARYDMSLTERLVTTIAIRSRRTVGEVNAVVRAQQQNHRHWFPPFDLTRWEFYANNVAATPVAQSAWRSRVAGTVDLQDKLGQAETPVLLIRTEGDGQVAARAQAELAAGLPCCRTESIDNCGRLPFVTHPHRLVKLLRSFWEEASAGTTGG